MSRNKFVLKVSLKENLEDESKYSNDLSYVYSKMRILMYELEKTNKGIFYIEIKS